MEPYKVLPLRVRIDVRVMAMKRYSMLPRAPKLELSIRPKTPPLFSRESYPSVDDAVSVFQTPLAVQLSLTQGQGYEATSENLNQ